MKELDSPFGPARPLCGELLRRLATDTGGRAFRVRALAELPETIEKLSRELRNHGRANDGKYRPVPVEITDTMNRPALNVSRRCGYYSPFQ